MPQFASRAHAQPAPVDSAPARPVLLGTPAETRWRDAQLLGLASPDGLLLRAASTRGSFATERGPGFRVLAPDAHTVWNSALPFSGNDGVLWAGRGWSADLRGGIDVRRGRVRVLLMPEVTVSQNRPFDVAPSRAPGRGQYAWAWSNGRFDIDLPSRLGDRTWRVVSPGQSAVVVDVGAVATGVATENQWWGPGIRNALVLSNNAEGYPHAFVRTNRPLRTPIGVVEAEWSLGVLTPSLFTRDDPARDWRSMSALAATLRPGVLPGLTLGLARAVVAGVERPAGAAAHALDALTRWSGLPRDSTDQPSADQYASLFARWIIAPAHTEAYVEWGRQGTPRSVRELLLAPQEGGALTLGLQTLQPVGAGGKSHVRVQLEATSLEQSIAFRRRPTPPPFYTGLATRDGYTHRGQVLGAAIGPGSSSQWVATDLVRPRYEAGLFAGRIRWNNDALYAQQGANFFRHDVSTFLGARGTVRAPTTDLALEGYWGRRYNYLFQNGFANPGGHRTVDVTNVTVVLTVTPR